MLGSFFFNKIKSIEFEWSEDFPHTKAQMAHFCDELADATYVRTNGGTHRIRIHPTRTSVHARCMDVMGLTLQEEQFGTLLHELIHCFLTQLTCRDCEVYRGYRGGGHGRGFQLIAEAIEENALALFGVGADIGRLNSILADIEGPPPEELRGPSVHDMQIHGFLDKPKQFLSDLESSSSYASSQVEAQENLRKRERSESLDSTIETQSKGYGEIDDYLRLEKTDLYLAKDTLVRRAVTGPVSIHLSQTAV